ncbi:MAG: succinylglutamate desuccinylase/aspartoacylase family protein [Clostridiales bacterium]|jgi:predicted deacylase|nr:succinylglutamate desuccinylase/aspartoacylase family protein [Clostridiales bacterium]
MIKIAASVELPVGESLVIQKNRIEPVGGLSGKRPKRICVVTGTHGDELEGQYVAWRLSDALNKHIKHLHGIVDIYPAINPLGINSINRGMPLSDLDLNRIFPGNANGPIAEYLASEALNDMKGADACIDIHASNIFLRELPQIRINELMAEDLLPLARRMNMPLIWIHASATVLESTLAHSLNSLGTPTLVVEMGVGMRITKEYGEQLVDGIFSLMSHLGIWSRKTPPTIPPIVSSDWQVAFINSNHSGIFISEVSHISTVQQGQRLGFIADPLSGRVLERINSPVTGLLFTLREYPVVYEGSLLARILHGDPGDPSEGSEPWMEANM